MNKILPVLLLLTLSLAKSSDAFNAASFSTDTTYVITPYSPAFGASQDFSVEFRIKTSGWTGDPAIISDKDWASGSNVGFVISLENNGNGLTINVGDGTNRADITNGTINDGQWHHVLVKFARIGNMSLYIDGSLVQQTPMLALGNINSNYNLMIAQDGTQDYPFGVNGELSEVKIWNKVLSLSEIERCDTINSSHPSWNDLLHYWKLNEGQGATLALDSKGTANGTFTPNVTHTAGNTFISGCGATSLATNGIGAGNALNFDGINDYVKVPNSTFLRPTSAITLEAWIYPRSFTTEYISPISHAVDNGSTESGYDFSWLNGRLIFRLKTASQGGNAWNSSAGTNEYKLNKWQHIAGVYDGDSIYFYLNGVLSQKIAASGAINWANLPTDFRIGAYHDSNEDFYFDGKIDEVRLWSVARTPSELRASLCQKLVGNEPGLAAYYRLDEMNTLEAFDASPNGLNGVLTNMTVADYVYSGAAIGNQSDYAYPTSWSGISTSVNSTNRGIFTADSIVGFHRGIHVYRVDTLPNTTNGLNDYADNTKYFGVFFTDSGSARLTLDYNNYPTATTNESTIGLYTRPANDVPIWISTPSITVAASNNIRYPTIASREVILSDFSQNTCTSPSITSVSAVGTTSATVNFTTTGSLPIQIQYGVSGSDIGSDTLIINPSSGTAVLNGLVNNSNYEVYIRRICGLGDTSAWVGPFTFTTIDACPVPTNITVSPITATSATLNWISPGSNWDIEWGTANFVVGSGINANISSNPYTLYGLTSVTDYKFYIRNNCGSQISAWVGPFTFTTDTINIGIKDAAESIAVVVFPNPNKGIFEIITKLSGSTTLKIVSITGDILKTLALTGKNNRIDVSFLPNGVYTILLENEKTNTSTQRKLIILK